VYEAEPVDVIETYRPWADFHLSDGSFNLYFVLKMNTIMREILFTMLRQRHFPLLNHQKI